MTSLLRFLIVVVITGFAGQALAQGTSGAIQGTVVDENGDPVITAQIQVSTGGITKGGAVTDIDGKYVIKPLEPGSYDLKVNYIGYKESQTRGVLVQPGKNTEVNVKLQPSEETKLDEVVITEYKVPLIDKFQGGSTTVKTSKEIEQMPTRNTTAVVSTSAGAYSAVDGGAISMTGARSDGTLYIIDGVQVYGSRGINVSQGAIGQIQVITSGLPANYGDAIGGVVTITTKGVSDQLRGSLLLEKSVEGYGHNLLNFTLSGPLVKKRIDSINKKPVVGFFLAGDAWYDKDRSPDYHGVYLLKDEKRDEIRQNPLVTVPNQSGVPVFRNRGETITANDLYITRQRPNAQVFEGRLTGRLDFQLDDNLNLSAGGTFNYSKAQNYGRGMSLLAVDEIPFVQNYTGRGFLRLQQSFRKNQAAPAADGETQQKQVISNAFYTLQVDYQTEYQKIENPLHKENIFNYGYVGKFTTEYIPIYLPGIDSAASAYHNRDVYGTRLLVDRATVQTTYERSDMNPLLANYTSQYFRELDGISPGGVQEIRARNSLINGQMPAGFYGYASSGLAQSSFSRAGVQQYGVTVDASFDLQPRETRHSIEFGLYYQQRNESQYGISGAGAGNNLWQYMRQLTNTHIGLDYENPVYIVDGQRLRMQDLYGTGGVNFSPDDTIFYERKVTGVQSNFDKNLRAKLGKSATDYIAIDELDPSTFSVDMFNADELLNSGNPFVSYYGYDYKGNRQRGQVNFNDFFTKKDENGNYTRDIGAYRPNYIAGYILDKFQFKDIFFNVGLRVERFDANTKVLKDPYSLYEVNSVSDSRNIKDEFGNPKAKYYEGVSATPANIGDDYVVYVNNNESSAPTIIGYRNGDDWYDPFGRLVEDPTTLRQYSGGRDPQPFLVNPDTRITDSTFDPNSSFTDYKPQINVMPRILFNFPISDNAMFYAHYDVVVQRPKVGVFTPASSYYFLTANQGGFVNNPDLKPEKMFDYEVGFKQKLSENSAVTISGFYIERKDMIQVRPYLYAWPSTYYTFGNRDFSTTKGLKLHYDMRRARNLRLDIAYTLQFANGTGSNATSSISGSPSAPGLLSGFISAGLPNIRTMFPLDNDVRHNIVTTLDYRYGPNKGPMVGDKHILQNAGANLIFRTRSGEPYTRYTQPGSVANTVDGQVNGARLPWHYWLDLRIDKDFNLNFGKKDGDVTRTRRQVYLNAYVLINNVLNTRDVLAVDRYTGRPDDDGYLSHPQGIQNANNQFNKQSYIDLYSATLIGIGSDRVNLPRRINLGLNLNF